MIVHRIYEVMLSNSYPNARLHELDFIPLGRMYIENNFETEEAAHEVMKDLHPEGLYTVLKIYKRD